MRNGSFLRVRCLSDMCCLPYDMTERELRLREGLVLTDDSRVLFRGTAFYISPDQTPYLVLDGEPLYTGPCEELRPCGPLPWFPFCVDGKWGYADAYTGEVAIPPKFAFCDCHEANHARYSLTGDFSGLNQPGRNGAWGLLDDGLEESIPPVYQYLSCVQYPSYTLLAKKNGRWGLLDICGHEELPFRWDNMTFAKYCVIAEDRAGGESRYSIFYEGDGYDYEGPPREGSHRGRLQGTLLLDDLTAVLALKRDDALPSCCRLVEQAGRWGVVDCVKGWLIEPALSRHEAEAEFWEREDAWGGGPA